MSESSLLNAEPALVPPRPRVADLARSGSGVRWAAAGGVIVVFAIFIWTKWLTGPDFHHVSSGPSVPPTWMKVLLIALQAAFALGSVLAISFLIVRPVIRDHKLSRDGVFTLAFMVLWVQDPLANMQGYWFIFNSWMVNMGSWDSLFPGWQGYTHRGVDPTEPLLLASGFYIWVWLHLCKLGARVLRYAHRRWPGLGRAGAVMLVLVPFFMIMDFLGECCGFAGIGAVTLPGGAGPVIFPDSYSRFPLACFVMMSAMCSALTVLYFYTDDRGESFCERGIGRLGCGPKLKTFVRFLSLVAATQLIFLVCYSVPASLILGTSTTRWPDAITSKSYFTNHICGAETPRICPGPGVPRAWPGSVQLSPDGKLVIPANSAAARLYGLPPGKSLVVPTGLHAPKPVPFNNKSPKPFSGRLVSGF